MYKKNPKISVIMSCYNRKDYLIEAIESILNQSYSDFEFIIVDDASTDGSQDIIKKYADLDSRIIFIKNDKTKGLINNLNKAFELTKGEYIARMDDDDISLPERFAKQIEYMDTHPEITLLGSFIEVFGDETAVNWVCETDSSILEILMNFFNPLCHPSVMIRKSFLDEHNLKYSLKAIYAEEYDLWKNIILAGGKLANLPENLLKYRVHKNSITKSKRSNKIQRQTANKIKEQLLKRYFDSKTTQKIINTINQYPFEDNNHKLLYETLETIKSVYIQKNLNTDPIRFIQEKYCGKPCTMEIFFASDDKFTQHMSVAIASILVNSLPCENFNFYILDGGISDVNKNNLLKLKNIKDFNIEFIPIDNNLFKDCQLTKDCKHITKQTYYRLIIPRIKPELEKCFYFDCDIVVTNSLNKFWNCDLENFYVAGVEELWSVANSYYQSQGVSYSFNAGVMLINNKLWIKDDIPSKLLKNAITYKDNLKWLDEDLLNYTLNNRVKIVPAKYNLQQTAFFDTRTLLYSQNALENSKKHPVIIHYSGHLKPWNYDCWHPLWSQYLKYLKYTPFKNNVIKILLSRNLNFRNLIKCRKTKTHKIISIMGLQLNIKRKHKNKKKRKCTSSPIREMELAKIQESFLWDPLWYINQYNYNFQKRDALEYWYDEGWKQGESPSKYLNVKSYQQRYNVIDRNPLLHYLEKGRYWNYYPDNKNNYKTKYDSEKINEYNKYKKTRKATTVVYTCITNDYDDIYEIETYKYLNKDCDYVCFTDNEEHIKLGQIGIWEIKPLQCNEGNNTLNNRWHKTHPHILFPQYEDSIYIDANINILTNKLFENIKTIDQNIVLPIHFNNVCIYHEYEWALKSSIDKKENVEKGFQIITESKMPRNYGFTENNIIYRKHHQQNVINLMEDWWNFIKNYTQRDQLSFSYLLWKYNIEIENITFKNARVDIENFYVFDHKKERNG